MTDENNNITQNPESQSLVQNRKDSKKPLFFITLIFIALIVLVFTTQKKEQIAWIEDYEKGIELAIKTNKPLLLVFYQPNAPMFVGAQNTTYNNPDVKKYVEANFIPVLINVVNRPDLARKFNISYYPTHYVKHPDSDKLFGPRLGGDPPSLFIEEMAKLLNRMKEYMR